MLHRLLGKTATRLEHLLEFRLRFALGSFPLDQETADGASRMVLALQLGRIVGCLTVASFRGFSPAAGAAAGAATRAEEGADLASSLGAFLPLCEFFIEVDATASFGGTWSGAPALEVSGAGKAIGTDLRWRPLFPFAWQTRQFLFGKLDLVEGMVEELLLLDQP